MSIEAIISLDLIKWFKYPFEYLFKSLNSLFRSSGVLSSLYVEFLRFNFPSQVNAKPVRPDLVAKHSQTYYAR